VIETACGSFSVAGADMTAETPMADCSIRSFMSAGVAA
jgi:hypothetical protein